MHNRIWTTLAATGLTGGLALATAGVATAAPANAPTAHAPAAMVMQDPVRFLPTAGFCDAEFDGETTLYNGSIWRCMFLMDTGWQWLPVAR
ncbi:hypothetical protein [Pseudonocardia sp. TMWB2A]|uniref:hypothetical protein n=1 Tax=Pseudonocardia sp. TMWB2A TaxID=687430 RepID=UPI00307EB0EB